LLPLKTSDGIGDKLNALNKTYKGLTSAILKYVENLRLSLELIKPYNTPVELTIKRVTVEGELPILHGEITTSQQGLSTPKEIKLHVKRDEENKLVINPQGNIINEIQS
jgi:hypothetical protein